MRVVGGPREAMEAMHSAIDQPMVDRMYDRGMSGEITPTGRIMKGRLAYLDSLKPRRPASEDAVMHDHRPARKATEFPAGSQSVADRHRPLMDHLLAAAREAETLIADAHDVEAAEFFKAQPDPHIDALVAHRERVSSFIVARCDLVRAVEMVAKGLRD